ISALGRSRPAATRLACTCARSPETTPARPQTLPSAESHKSRSPPGRNASASARCAKPAGSSSRSLNAGWKSGGACCSARDRASASTLLPLLALPEEQRVVQRALAVDHDPALLAVGVLALHRLDELAARAAESHAQADAHVLRHLRREERAPQAGVALGEH